MSDEKILLFESLVEKVEELKSSGKKVVQSFGVFDIIHPGIIQHLDEARRQGDVLIVTVIKDKDVKKGPGRPIFPENFRVQNVAALCNVDYVCLVDNETPFDCVKRIKPDIFARGHGYAERDSAIHERLFEQERELYFGKSAIYETKGFSFSSSSIINNFLEIYPDETKAFIEDFSKRHSFADIVERINRLKDLNVLLIGDGIIDEYIYCESMGKSPKAQLIVNRYVNHETFAGGVFAIANHIAGLCGTVSLTTLLGRDDSREDFIRKNLKANVHPKFFYREDGPTIVKKRYINQYQKQKIFEVNYINDNYIDDECEAAIIDYIESVVHQYDLVLVSDFGHGFITSRIIKAIERFSKKVAVNAQTNGANAGYNLITKYKNTDFICLDAPEARLATQRKYKEIGEVAKRLIHDINTEYLIITLGSLGSLCINKSGEIKRTPVFSTKVVDIIGAGDAFFSYAALCFAAGMSMDLVSFIGNSVGALAVQIVGNKRAVEKYELLEFIHTVLT